MFLRKYFHNLFKYILILICFLLMLVVTAFNANVDKLSFGSYMIQCFGGIPKGSSLDILKVFLWLVPNFIIIYSLSDIMWEDCAINYVYVFTRLAKKETWLFRKARQILLNTLVIYFIIFILGIVIGGLFHLKAFNIDIKNYSILFLSMYLLNVFSIYVISYAQNFISLKYGVSQSFIIAIIFYTFSILITLLAFNKNTILNYVLMFLIPNNQIYIWHEDCVAGNSIALFGFYQCFSYIFFILASALTYFVSRIIFKKLDLVEMIKEV